MCILILLIFFSKLDTRTISAYIPICSDYIDFYSSLCTISVCPDYFHSPSSTALICEALVHIHQTPHIEKQLLLVQSSKSSSMIDILGVYYPKCLVLTLPLSFILVLLIFPIVPTPCSLRPVTYPSLQKGTSSQPQEFSSDMLSPEFLEA